MRSMEGVWIKPEPVDAEYPVILNVKSEVEAGVEESAPSVILEPEKLDIKSEITLGEYEFSAGNTLTESKKEKSSCDTPTHSHGRKAIPVRYM
ncbi:hypothetical protein Bhyg_08456 [Pseudolycoriella hygida]|uniref:Uncharacterized protein n=1 Tax=Pseudolycoriella hygida TaxID=35572 RepID=A0A9Q0N6G1_9DIPT|nr:hypothetical protein Bhyg_08456 [Pseudolycoriella hygida]